MRNAAAILCVPLVAIVACGSDNSPGDPQPDSASDLANQSLPDDETRPPISPFDAAVQAELGLSIDEIGQAVTSRIEAEVAECLAEAGWPGDVTPMAAPSAAPTDLSASDLDRAITLFEASLAAGATGTPSGVDPDRAEAQQRCVSQVTSSVRNPLDPLFDLLGQGRSDLNARVQADSRWQQAQRRFVTCLDEVGLSPEDVGSQSAHLVDRANEVIDQYVAGTVELDEARASLQQLREDESVALGEATACRRSFQQIERNVYSTVEESYIAANAASFQALLREAESHLSAFKDYIPKS